MNSVQKVLAMREASRVERTHTIRHFGEYTDGQHSFDMLTLTLELREETSAALMKAIIYHDLSERWLGDPPFPAKAGSAKLADCMRDLEGVINIRMDWVVGLTDEEAVWLHAADRLEFLLWADDQLQMGNRHLEEVLARCRHWFETHLVPEAIQTFLKNYVWQRTPDRFPE